MTVFIAYGWPEGRWHAKQFVEALRDYGYQISKQPETADIIVAHSIGCYMLPAGLKAKLILLIGIPNWPHKSLFKCTFEKISLEPKNTYWLKKTFWHLVYAIFQPLRLYGAYRAYKLKYLPVFDHSPVVLVRNQYDAYLQQKASQQLAKERGWHLVQLNGRHDDLWQNPQPYIDILKVAPSI